MRTNTPYPLRPEHSEHLVRFRISKEILEGAGVQSVTNAEARDMLGISGHQGADLGGILFPYRSPLTGHRLGGRVRLDQPLSSGGKYVSERGCRYLFFPPNVADLLSDVSVPAVIVEAEKSALALRELADRAGHPLLPIAVGGCWGWLRTSGNQLLPEGGQELVTAPSPSFELIIWRDRTVIILFDSNAESNPKVRKARRNLALVLAGRGACVCIGRVPNGFGVNGPDDLIATSGDEAVLSVLGTVQSFDECALAECEQAIAVLEADKKTNPLSAIEAIAAIEKIERRALLIGRLVALRLPGASQRFVERQVARHRAEAEAARERANDTCRRSRLMAMDIRGAELLNKVCAFIQRFVSLLEVQARVLALWTVHTHAIAAADCTPYLSITSAEKQSGKSRLQEVLETIVANPWYTGRVTAAVLYRKINTERPTLLLDETDAAFKSGEEYGEALRGILNTGHRRGGKATCCVGQGVNISYQDFSTFSPKAIAGIGKLPDTVADRSIPIRLKRKARAEKVDRFRLRNVRIEAETLREQLEGWGTQILEQLRDATPELPIELSDRQQDGAEPLLAIADLAGDGWPNAARLALVSLCCGAKAEDDSIGTLILSDVRQIFVTRDTDRLPSAELANTLAEIETSPWGEWNRGRPITPIGVARLLKPFAISPHPVRNDDRVFRGYDKTDFEDAWERYLSPDNEPNKTSARSSLGPGNVTPLQPASVAAPHALERATGEDTVTPQECEKTSSKGFCNAVTLPEPRVEGTEEEL